jgi:hypothetical protein
MMNRTNVHYDAIDFDYVVIDLTDSVETINLPNAPIKDADGNVDYESFSIGTVDLDLI